MNIFKQFSNSIYDFKWLAGRRAEPKSAIAYFFFFTFVLSVVLGSWMSFQLLHVWGDAKTVFRDQVPYFQAEMKNGRLSVLDLDQPFTKETKEFVVIVDTATSSSRKITDYISGNEKKAVFLVSAQDFSFYRPDQNKTETNFFKDAPDFQTDKNKLLASAEKMRWLVFVIILLFLLLSYIAFSLANAVFLLFWSLILWVVSLISKKKWKYSEVLAVGAFAMTVPALLGGIISYAGLKLPYLSASLFLVYMIVVIFAFEEVSSEKVENKKDNQEIKK